MLSRGKVQNHTHSFLTGANRALALPQIRRGLIQILFLIASGAGKVAGVKFVLSLSVPLQALGGLPKFNRFLNLSQLFAFD